MKPGKINIPALILSFAIVGLIADLMPAPGLKDGFVARSANWMTNSLQGPANAAATQNR